MLFIYRTNTVGPYLEPWGTPQHIFIWSPGVPHSIALFGALGHAPHSIALFGAMGYPQHSFIWSPGVPHSIALFGGLGYPTA